MRKIKLLFLLLAVLLLVTSCKNVDDRTERLIPSDAVVVLKVDMPQFIKHSGVEIKDGKVVLPSKFQEMLNEMGGSKDVEKGLNKLMDSGIDLKHSSYAFMPKDAINGGDVAGVVLIPVEDANKVKDFIEDMTNAEFGNNGDVMVGRDGDDIFLIKDGTLCYTSATKADIEKDLIALLSPKSSISSNDAISKALGTDDDINVFMDTKQIKMVANKEIGNDRNAAAMAASSAMDIVDVERSALHISFANDECNIKSVNELAENSDFPKLVKDMTSAPNADLIPMVPSGDHTLIVSLSINGEGIANFSLVKELLGSVSDDPDFAKIINIFKSINGPVVFGIASNNLHGEAFDAVVATKTPMAADLHSLVDITPFAGEVQRQGGEYVMKDSNGGPSMVLGENNNVLYFKYLSGGTKESPQDEAVKSLFSQSVAALYCTSTIDGMKMQITASSKDLLDSDFTLSVMENGKKLCFLDALTFFAKLEKEFDSTPNSYPDSDDDSAVDSE